MCPIFENRKKVVNPSPYSIRHTSNKKLCSSTVQRHATQDHPWSFVYNIFGYTTTRVEWFSLFCDFQKRAHCYRLAIFLWVQFQKIGEFCCVRARRTRSKIFIFKKSQGPWKWIFFFKVGMNLPLTSKTNCQK